MRVKSIRWVKWMQGLGLAAGLTASGASWGASWDTFADTWVATDALNRSLPTFVEAGPPRPDRTVGLFYFLWLGPHVKGGPWDITRILGQNPGAMTNKASPPWGPLHAPHHWGESIFGYYNSDDPYVLRKHAQMLGDAGVDVIIFDVTNQLTYRSNYLALLREFAAVRANGSRTPQVAFLCPFWDPAKVVNELYHDLYAPGLYPELWFRWEKKPLILADPAKLGKAEQTDGIRRFFTFRRPQPDYFQGQTQPNMWSWLEVYPQHVFTNSAGQKEQMSVGAAQNAVGNRLGSMSEEGARGRSFHDGKFPMGPETELHGYNLAEQFERALQMDPRFIFVTGWNEWIAGRFDEFAGVRLPVMFVDEFDQEHSRDLEPMKGGHGDNYYYEFVSFVRRYKGVRLVTKTGPPRTIRLEDGFEQWADVTPEFRDDIGDTAHRDFPGYNNYARLANTSGRNDFFVLKLSRDETNLYFYANTRDLITPPTGANWMMLLIDTDQDYRTGWEGYDFVVNRVPATGSRAIVERNVGGWRWERTAEIPMRIEGNQIHLAIPRRLLGLEPLKGRLAFDFKWADNVPSSGNIVEWLDAGDCAPNGRFNYLFSE